MFWVILSLIIQVVLVYMNAVLDTQVIACVLPRALNSCDTHTIAIVLVTFPETVSRQSVDRMSSGTHSLPVVCVCVCV